jgi:hypothetical protein
MSDFKSEIIINKPIHVVYEYVNNAANNNNWQEVKSVFSIKSRNDGRTKSYKETQAYRGKVAESSTKIVKNSVDRKISLVTKLGSYKLNMTYDFEGDENTTKLMAAGNLSGGGLFTKSIWFWIVSPKMMQNQLGKNLGRLKTALEA